MNPSSRIYLAGHKGLIGSAIHRRLQRDNYTNIITRDRAQLDLRDPNTVKEFFSKEKPEYVILAAGRVGGITGNLAKPAEFLAENLAIELNVIGEAQKNDVKRLMFFGSSCMYPRECSQPMKESQLLTGMPEPTSLSYAIAKLAGVQLCISFKKQYGAGDYLPVIPNNAYGPNDDFNPASSHVLSALLRRFHEAKVNNSPDVTLWGTGTPRREFLYSDDIADACLFLLKQESLPEMPINIGCGVDYSIRELGEVIAKVVGFKGELKFDTTKPDGAPRKLLDGSKLTSMGWKSQIGLEEGIRRTYDWYLTEGQAHS